MTTATAAALTSRDVAQLLVDQAGAALDAGVRADVDDCLRDGDYDVALMVLVKALDAGGAVLVDGALLDRARLIAGPLLSL